MRRRLATRPSGAAYRREAPSPTKNPYDVNFDHPSFAVIVPSVVHATFDSENWPTGGSAVQPAAGPLGDSGVPQAWMVMVPAVASAAGGAANAVSRDRAARAATRGI